MWLSIPPLMGLAAFMLSKYYRAGEVSATGYAVILPLSRQVCIQFKPAHFIGASHTLEWIAREIHKLVIELQDPTNLENTTQGTYCMDFESALFNVHGLTCL